MSPQQFAYVLQHLTKHVGKLEVLKDITLSFYPDAKIGIIGPNGAGKSSLLRIMAGVDREFDGVATPMPGITTGYVAQEPVLDTTLDVKGNVELGLKPVRDLLKRFEDVCDKLGTDLTPEEMDKTLALQEKLQGEIDAVSGWELERRIEIAMDAMRLPPGDADVRVLSGGEKRRVALCKTLLAQPQMLLLDEPTNHLDAESVAWLERTLNEYPGCVLVVTHDRYFLEDFCGWILEMESGRGIPWKGNYSMWIDQKKEGMRVEQDQQRKRRRALERELEWVRASARGRQAKSKARLSAYDKMAEAEGTDSAPDIEILIPAGPRLGDLVLRAEKVTKGYGSSLLMEDMTFDLPPGAILGVVGPNGAGKTTLLRMIMGQEKPDFRDSGSRGDGGARLRGPVARIAGRFETGVGRDRRRRGGAQVRQQAREHTGVLLVVRLPRRGPAEARGHALRRRAQSPALGEAAARGGNLLLLDEPTNDLDVNTLRALEEALLASSGSAVIVTHDRWFLDRVATHILAFEGDSQVRFVPGNWQGYEEDRVRRLGADAARPHRIRYKPIAR